MALKNVVRAFFNIRDEDDPDRWFVESDHEAEENEERGDGSVDRDEPNWHVNKEDEPQMSDAEYDAEDDGVEDYYTSAESLSDFQSEIDESQKLRRKGEELAKGELERVPFSRTESDETFVSNLTSTFSEDPSSESSYSSDDSISKFDLKNELSARILATAKRKHGGMGCDYCINDGMMAGIVPTQYFVEVARRKPWGNGPCNNQVLKEAFSATLLGAYKEMAKLYDVDTRKQTESKRVEEKIAQWREEVECWEASSTS